MVDEIFEEIKEAFLENFEDVKVFNAVTDIEIEFKHKNDSDWFNENIAYPKNLEKDEYPIKITSSINPDGISENYLYKFKIKNMDNKDILIDMLNSRKEGN